MNFEIMWAIRESMLPIPYRADTKLWVYAIRGMVEYLDAFRDIGKGMR